MVGKLLVTKLRISHFEANVRQERDRRRQTRTRTLQQTSFALEAGSNWKTPRQIQGLSTVNLQLQTVCYHKLPILGGQEMSRIHKNSGALRENLFWANFDEDLQTPRRGVGWSHLVALNTATRAILYSSVFLVISQVWFLHVPSKTRVRPHQQTTHPNNMIYLSPEDEWKHWLYAVIFWL